MFRSLERIPMFLVDIGKYREARPTARVRQYQCVGPTSQRNEDFENSFATLSARPNGMPDFGSGVFAPIPANGVGSRRTSDSGPPTLQESWVVRPSGSLNNESYCRGGQDRSIAVESEVGWKG